MAAGFSSAALLLLPPSPSPLGAGAGAAAAAAGLSSAADGGGSRPVPEGLMGGTIGEPVLVVVGGDVGVCTCGSGGGAW